MTAAKPTLFAYSPAATPKSPKPTATPPSKPT